MFGFRVYKLFLIVLFCVITQNVFGQVETNKIKLRPPGHIIGQYGDTIYNKSSGVWNFSNDTLKNVVIQGLETVASADNTYWVSPGFPNAGKFYRSIQAALDAIVAPQNSTQAKTIIVFPGKYQAFIVSKPYIHILGLGSPIIDSLIVNFQTEIIASNVTLENLTYVDDYVELLTGYGTYMTAIKSNVGITLKNIKVLYNDVTSLSDIDETIYLYGVDLTTQNIGNSFIEDCVINIKLTHKPDAPVDEYIYNLKMFGIAGSKFTGFQNSIVVNNSRIKLEGNSYDETDSLSIYGIYYNQSVFVNNDNELSRFKIKDTEIELKGVLKNTAKYYSIGFDVPGIIQNVYSNKTVNLTSSNIFYNNFFNYPTFKITE